MTKQISSILLTLSTSGARLTGQGFLGNGVSSAAIEDFSRIVAGELGPSGRVICLRQHAIPEAVATSHTGEVFTHFVKQLGTAVDGMLRGNKADELLLFHPLAGFG